MPQMKECRLCQMPRPATEDVCLICGSAEFGSTIDQLPDDFELRLIGENRLPAAYAYLESLVARGEDSAEHCHRLAWLAFAFSDFRAVEIWSHETLRLDDGMMEAHLLLGLVLQRAGRWEEAAEEYSAGLRKSATLPQRRARLEALLADVRLKFPEY
jgi:hypothetical protein